MNNILLMVLLFSFYTTSLFSQGVFTSLATGNWNAAGSWTLLSGTDADNIPDADDDVTIGSAHVITVSASTTVECNNLTVAGGSATSVSMAGANSILNVYGSLSATSAPTAGNYVDCTADATAKMVFKRSTSGALITGTWGTYGEKVRVEVNLGSDITGTAAFSVKFRELIVTSGTFSTTGELRPDEGVATTGKVTIENGATLICTRVSRTGTAGTAFASFTINGTGKAVFSLATAFPSTGTTLTFSSTSTIEYAGASSYAVVDRNYEGNLIFSGSLNKTWTLSASPRTVGGNITVSGTSAFRILGGQVTVSGNVTVDEGATIDCNNHSALFVAAASGTQTFTLNGTARVTSNASQTGNPTTGFNRQYAFDAYSIGANSVISFRNPTAAQSVVLNIDQPTGVSFANVEFYDLQTAAFTCEFILRQNIEVTGSIAFPRNTSGQAIIFNMNGNTLKVGKQILNTLGTIGSNIGNTNSGGGTRTYTMDGTVELNGSSSQTTLGGTDLPSTLNNLTINNAAGITLANNIAVNGTLSVTSGDFDLNGKTLTLGGSALVIETSGNTIKGTTGTITTTRSLNAPSLSNIAGLGATLTSNADLGSTVITRGHTVQTGNTNNGVGRYYDITPTTNTGLNASLVFSYDESELNGIPEADLRLFRSTDGGTSWTLAGGTVDEGSNNVTLSGIDAFSRWTLGDINNPLPVELNAFTYKLSGNKIDLSWSTATEVNASRFEIERKSASSDWTKIGEVAASGNSNSPKEYMFTDNSVTSGQVVYRLKIVDNDGSFAYSKEIEVENLQPSTFDLRQNYPNPFNPSTVISYQLPVNSQVKLVIYSITGEMVRELVNANQDAGVYNVTLDASGLASGTYIYRLVAGDFVSVKKMVVLK